MATPGPHTYKVALVTVYHSKVGLLLTPSIRREELQRLGPGSNNPFPQSPSVSKNKFT